MGHHAVTKTGIECQKWTDKLPHGHGIDYEKPQYSNKQLGDHNYCRNPDNEPYGAWCFTTNPDVRMEYCSCDYYV